MGIARDCAVQLIAVKHTGCAEDSEILIPGLSEVALADIAPVVLPKCLDRHPGIYFLAHQDAAIQKVFLALSGYAAHLDAWVISPWLGAGWGFDFVADFDRHIPPTAEVLFDLLILLAILELLLWRARVNGRRRVSLAPET